MANEQEELRNKVEDFLEKPEKKPKEKPEEYDFKLEMKKYYETHNKDGKYDSLIKDIKEKIDEEEDNIRRWFAYKTLDVEYEKELEKIPGKEERPQFFDCDNWNDTCELTKGIYYFLWGWEKAEDKKINFGNSPIYKETRFENALGGDTMNSLATTMEQYFHVKGVEKCKKAYEKNMEKCKEVGFDKFARNVSCIGNFVLVPSGFNGRRGKHSCIKDYWDLSLDCMAHIKDSWLPWGEDGSCPVKRPGNSFIQYINTFFLWDYVDGTYEVQSLFSSHDDKIGDGKPFSNKDVLPMMKRLKSF